MQGRHGIAQGARSDPSRGHYHHGHLRSALVGAALKLVAKRGAEGFSLREAARELGVSPAAAYRHFADKAALLGAVAIDGMGRLAAEMEKGVARVPGPPGTAAHAAGTLLAVGGAYVEFALRHRSHFRVMFGPWCEHPAMDQLPPEVLPGGRDPYQILIDALDALVASGAVTAEARRGAEIAAWSTMHGLASLLVDGAIELPARQRAAVTAGLGRTLLLGLACHPSVAGPASAPVDGDPRHQSWKGKRRC